jgi:hypothetical protein
MLDGAEGAARFDIRTRRGAARFDMRTAPKARHGFDMRTAPKARQRLASGKREARSLWTISEKFLGSKSRQKCAVHVSVALSGLKFFC